MQASQLSLLLYSIKLKSQQGHKSNSLRGAWAMHVSSTHQKKVLSQRLLRLPLATLSLSLSTDMRARLSLKHNTKILVNILVFIPAHAVMPLGQKVLAVGVLRNEAWFTFWEYLRLEISITQVKLKLFTWQIYLEIRFLLSPLFIIQD